MERDVNLYNEVHATNKFILQVQTSAFKMKSIPMISLNISVLDCTIALPSQSFSVAILILNTSFLALNSKEIHEEVDAGEILQQWKGIIMQQFSNQRIIIIETSN